jgi:hypothetical protein
MTAYQEKLKQALISGALLQCTEGKNYKTWLVYPNGKTETVRRDSAEKVCETYFNSLVFGETNGIRWYKKVTI